MSKVVSKISVILPKKTYYRDISKLVSQRDRIIIKNTRCGNPSGICLIRKYNKLVIQSFVLHKMHTFLNIGHENSWTQCADMNNTVWKVLKIINGIIFLDNRN